MNQTEWQAKLDGIFPDGVQVTVLEADPIRFLATRLTVVDALDDMPTVCVFPVNVDKNFQFRIHELLELDDQMYVVNQPDTTLQIQLDTRFSAEAAESLKELRNAQ